MSDNAETREAQGYVVGFMVDPHSDEVLLVRKNRPAWQAGRLNGIGGHIEPGEIPAEAMEREFQEETGLTVGPWEHIVTMTFPGAAIWFYRCRPAGAPVLFAEARTTTDEPIERHRITDLLAPGAPIIPNLRWLLPLAAYQADDYEPFTVSAASVEALAAPPPVAGPEVRPDETLRARVEGAAHRVEWAVLSDDGRIYEVEGKAHERAFHEAGLLREDEPTARVVERRICTWAATLLHESDAIPPEAGK